MNDQEVLRELLSQDLRLNQVWAQFNLIAGYTKRLDFHKMYNDLFDLGLVEDEKYYFGKLPVGDYTGVKCNKV